MAVALAHLPLGQVWDPAGRTEQASCLGEQVAHRCRDHQITIPACLPLGWALGQGPSWAQGLASLGMAPWGLTLAMKCLT